MALDIPIPNEADEVVVQKTATSTTRITGVLFDFDNTSALAFVAFGNLVNGVFETKRTENWNLSGEFYVTSIMAPPQGETMAEALLGSVAGVIAKIQTDPILKQELLNSGELVI